MKDKFYVRIFQELNQNWFKFTVLIKSLTYSFFLFGNSLFHIIFSSDSPSSKKAEAEAEAEVIEEHCFPRLAQAAFLHNSGPFAQRRYHPQQAGPPMSIINGQNSPQICSELFLLASFLSQTLKQKCYRCEGNNFPLAQPSLLSGETTKDN